MGARRGEITILDWHDSRSSDAGMLVHRCCQVHLEDNLSFLYVANWVSNSDYESYDINIYVKSICSGF